MVDHMGANGLIGTISDSLDDYFGEYSWNIFEKKFQNNFKKYFFKNYTIWLMFVLIFSKNVILKKISTFIYKSFYCLKIMVTSFLHYF